MVQDITVFYEKCKPMCNSNICPDALPYFKHPLEQKCVNICPAGYVENGDQCVAV